MKLEGRQQQHEMVRTYPVWSDQPNRLNPGQLINNSNSPPITGTFTQVPPKSTNHSKYSGRCHRRSCGKSQDKVKGSHKWRWHDAVYNHGVAARWAEEGGRRLGFYSGYDGVSAAGLLENLAIDVDRDDDDYEDI